MTSIKSHENSLQIGWLDVGAVYFTKNIRIYDLTCNMEPEASMVEYEMLTRPKKMDNP